MDTPENPGTEWDARIANLASDRQARPAIVDAYGAARSDADGNDAAAAILDALAKAAPSNGAALETLLDLVYRHGLARSGIRRVLISEQDVADAEQATLASVALNIEKFEGRSRFTTWLHQIGLNEARMMVRTRERRPPGPPAVEPVHDAAFFARLSTIVGNRDLVMRALQALPDHYRDVVVLRELEGLEYEEISSNLDVPVGTVRSRLSRGREMLAAAVRAA